MSLGKRPFLTGVRFVLEGSGVCWPCPALCVSVQCTDPWPVCVCALFVQSHCLLPGGGLQLECININGGFVGHALDPGGMCDDVMFM